MINYIDTDPRTLLHDQDKCLDILVDALGIGCLNLVVGAGVSLSSNQYIAHSKSTIDLVEPVKSGFPSWIELTEQCCRATSVDFDSSKAHINSYLEERLSEIKSKCSDASEFNNLLSSKLFEGTDISLNNYSSLINPKQSGFPSWIDLTIKSCSAVGIDIEPDKLSQNSYLLSMLELVRKKCKSKSLNFHKLIKECLFDNVSYDIKSLSSELLVAIGALVMNSTKSNLTNVINYNFDDLLEWYLSYHGFDVQVISDTNSLITTSDIVVYHPHGFLPKSEQYESYESEKIILSKRDYVEANWNENFWNSIQHNIFSNKINLFIGLSGEDSHIESMSQYVYDRIVIRDRILGIMVLNKRDKSDTIEQQNIENGIVNYYVDDYSDIPELLLSITRRARGIE